MIFGNYFMARCKSCHHTFRASNKMTDIHTCPKCNRKFYYIWRGLILKQVTYKKGLK